MNPKHEEVCEVSVSKPEYDERGRYLYQVGDKVTIPFLRYPGPVPAPVDATVIKRHSPTYYELEWNESGKTKRRSLIRSQLP